MPNNRSHKRNPFRSPCTIRYVLPGAASAELVSGVTRDLSRGGLGIVVKESLPRGTSTRVTLSLPGGKTVELTGTVAFCRHAQGSWYVVGIQFKSADHPQLQPLHERAGRSSRRSVESHSA